MKEASGVASGLTSLPSGGGGIAPLGDKFQPDLVKGTGNYAIPISLPKGPGDIRPSLSLNYSTGAGNGTFGFGWKMNHINIERRTDRGIPSYTDDDAFIFSNAEALVAVGGNKFRPKTDNKFWQIEKLTEGWRIRHGNGVTWLLGQTNASREIDGTRIFAWYLDEEIDQAGNSIKFKYKRDANKLYLESIEYSIFSVSIEYETRPDKIRNGRAGFERITALRGKQINLHCSRTADNIIKTYEFIYAQALNGSSMLTTFKMFAVENGKTANFPALTFTYSDLNLNKWNVHEILSAISPGDLQESTQMVDMTGNGLPDILKSTESNTLLWRNAGQGVLEGPVVLDEVPSILNLSKPNVAFADLNGNGRVDLFSTDNYLQVVYENNGNGGFDPVPVVFQDRPGLRLSEGNSRLTDLNGDGVIDLLSSGLTHFLLYNHVPGKGWQDPIAIPRINDIDAFPDVDLSSPGVKLADLTGDGLQDIVYIKSGSVSFWPHMGNGNWGRRVEMENAPLFPRGYRESRLHVVDIDGDGCSDLVYFDSDRTLIWINQSGNRFSDMIEIPVAPITSSAVLSADFMGDGKTGFIWSSTRTVESSAGYRYLRFDDGKKPYLLTNINNGMGGNFEMEYASHLHQGYGINDGGPQARLPFPVHVVKTIREKDAITLRSTEYSMNYHEGVYDGPLREFRGFSFVTVDTKGDDSSPGMRQEIRFFQGNPDEIDLKERSRQRALAGSTTNIAISESVNGVYRKRQESNQHWDARIEFDNTHDQVYFPFISDIKTIEYGTAGSPDKIETTKLEQYDAFGNLGKKTRESFADGAPAAATMRTEERFTFTQNSSSWLVKLPVRSELFDKEGKLFGAKISYYDGEDFIGLPEAQAQKGLLSRTRELKLSVAKLPAGYIGTRNFATMGYELVGAGDSAAYYSTVFSVKRDTKGNVTVQKDALGHTVSMIYDSDFVYPVKTVALNGDETILTFNPRSGEPLTTVFSDGRKARQEFDPLGRLIANYETPQAGTEQLLKCWAIDTAAVPVSITSFSPSLPGHTRAELTGPAPTPTDVSLSKVFYDGFGKECRQITTATEDATGNKRYVVTGREKINAKGLVTIKYPAVFASDLSFTSLPLPDAGCVKQNYDFNGNVTETEGPSTDHFRIVRDTFSIKHYEGTQAGPFGIEVPPGNPSRIENFDAHGRLVKIEEFKGDGSSVVTSYDLTLDGKIKTVHIDGQLQVTYSFAGSGEALVIDHRDTGKRVYYRDASGNLTERVNPDGSSLFYTYDAMKRLVNIKYKKQPSSAEELVREMFYDADPFVDSSGRFLKGRIAVLKEAGNTFRYSYSSSGKVVKEEVTTAGVTLITQSEYDIQGHCKAVIYPDGHKVNYIVHANGVVTGIPGYLSNTTYAADGNAEKYQLANGVEVSMPRDIFSRRLQSVAANKNVTLLRRMSYGYDGVGNITSLLDEIPGDIEFNSYSYDGLHRLTGFTTKANSAAGTILKTGAYSYDAAGNIVQFGDTNSLSLQYTDPVFRGRATSIKNMAQEMPVGYDSNGCINSMGDLNTLEYDAMDRLAKVVKKDGTDIRFAYDAQGRRILKEVTKNGVTKRVRYAGGLYEQHEDHATRNIFFGTFTIASEKIVTTGAPPVQLFYVNDHHGTLLMATDSSGVVIHNQRYSPFGAALKSSVTLDKYLGKEKDIETGLIHLGARYFSPQTGRFISPDWYVLEKPDKPMRMPQGYNIYGYAMNNPLIFKDPSGMWFGIDDLIVAAVGFVVGFVGGLIYGLANGQGWGSFLTALETGLTTAAGAWLGWNTSGVFGLINGGINGFVGGIHGIYDWTSPEGWFAFISDSTWGMLGTSFGNVVHIINLFGDTNYREDLSRRQNRHVYEGGFYLKDGFAFTQGNVISNAGRNGKGINASFLADHEELHIWQNRFFGPLFQGGYVAWAVGAFIVGSIYWLFNTDQKYGSVIETLAYYDNPFEYWAYKNDSNWPPSKANSNLTY